MHSARRSCESDEISICTAHHVGQIDRLRGIYESVGRDRMYGRVHACKEAQACVASSSMRAVCEPLNILKILKLSD